ncbi:MAG: DUF4115 domain-containing protein, partial [Dysgonamonadaceae bacterium]|nr:DUF4115 domain-containing protein [Dysgonamonadaceae bacterium]
ELYIENRFFLTFSGQADIPPANAARSNIIVQRLAPQTVRIASDSGSPLGRLQITDVQGKVIISREVKESSYTFRAPAPGVYIVRVGNSAGVRLRNLVIKN